MLCSHQKGLTLTVAALAAALGAGCTGNRPATPNETGAARVSVRLSALTTDIASVKLTVSGGTPALSAPIVVTLASNGKQGADAQYTGLVSGIPAGTGCVFQADAYKADGTTRIYSGSATADIAAGSTALVYILAQEVNGGQTATVWMPVVDSLTASDSAVAPGATVNVAVAAHSPYTPADALSYLWSAACSPGSDNGTFTNGTLSAASWVAPATNPSTCVLSVAIKDQHINKVTAYLIISVQAASTGSPGVTVYANTWPVIASAFADVKYDQPTGTPPVMGTTTEADLTVQAADPDGDNLAYSWSDGSCGGHFSDSTAAQTHYSVADSKSCTLTVTVTDLCTNGDCAGAKDSNGVALTDGSQRGGHISAIFNIAAKPSLAQSPVITLTMQPNADGTVTAGSSYALRVDATDPQNQALTFTWSATAGSISETSPFTAASPASSLMTWQAPATLASVMDVTVSIADGTAAPAKAYTFHFHSSDPCVSLADGASCTLNACITGSTCLSHACQGGTAKVAPALTPCQASASCDPNTGNYTVSNKVDGTACSSGSLCQTGEVCAAGACGGGAAVVCSQPTNTCTAVGACVPATGCPAPENVVAGTACTGTDKCLQNFACDGNGTCVGSTPVQCDASNPCVTNAVCDSVKGCVGTNAPDMTPCNTNSSVNGMMCMSGMCMGGTKNAVPGAPTAVAASLDNSGTSVIVTFAAPADTGGSTLTGYAVTSTPSGLTASGTTSPITVACSSSCAGYAFTVAAINSVGTGAASAPVDVVTSFKVVETYYEPMTQPDNSIFTGTFTLDSTTRTVTNLAGSLTESMTMPKTAPMTTVPLTYQLSDVSDGLGGQLVTVFLLNTTNTFDPSGFAPGGSIFYGYATGATNPKKGGVGNAYAMIDVNIDDPTAPATQAQINLLAYADCTAGGMMMYMCMTGTTVAGYGTVGTMDGYPISQIVSKQ